MLNETLIRGVHLFSELDPERFARVVATTRMFALAEGERLFDVGQPAERFYLMVSGQMKLYRVSEEGQEKIIEILVPGVLFAEAVAFMRHHRYPVSAGALQASVVYGFDNQTLLDMLHDSSDLCLNLIGTLSRRLHYVLREIDHLTLQNATFRIVAYLLELLPDPHARSARIELNAPKHVIASRLSVTPETFSRILNTLGRQGILSSQGRQIDIADVARLRGQVHREDLPADATNRPSDRR